MWLHQEQGFLGPSSCLPELRLTAEKNSHMFMQRRQGDVLERRAVRRESPVRGGGGRRALPGGRHSVSGLRAAERGGGEVRVGPEGPCRLSKMLGFIHMGKAMGIQSLRGGRVTYLIIKIILWVQKELKGSECG